MLPVSASPLLITLEITLPHPLLGWSVLGLYVSIHLSQAACDSLADTVFNTVWTLGCRPFMNSQRAACICAEEEKEEL